jgi:hypothetical protein
MIVSLKTIARFSKMGRVFDEFILCVHMRIFEKCIGFGCSELNFYLRHCKKTNKREALITRVQLYAECQMKYLD